MKDIRALTELVEDMTEDELETLANLVGGLNRLAMEDGSPVYTDEEIDLIGRFADVPQADDEDEDETDKDRDSEIMTDTGPVLKSITEAHGNTGWGF